MLIQDLKTNIAIKFFPGKSFSSSFLNYSGNCPLISLKDKDLSPRMFSMMIEQYFISVYFSD